MQNSTTQTKSINNQIHDKNSLTSSSASNENSPVSSVPPEKGIQILLQFRNQVNNKDRQESNLLMSGGGISRKYRSAVDPKHPNQQQSKNMNSNFICPNTNQTFHEKDAKQVYLV